MNQKEMITLVRGESMILRGEQVIAGRKNAPAVTLHAVDRGQKVYEERESSTVYGFATESGRINTPSGMYWLSGGMYFSTPAPCWMEAPGVLVSVDGWRGIFNLGGPIESKGRLRYIDGCSDTLLIGPPRCGDPCFNHLHFPPGIRQTMHTHPSLRCGIVASGRGRAQMGCGDELPLRPGDVWILPCGGRHCFFTDDESMAVIAFHPDTDTGPRDDDHPMLNRTYVDGVSAAKLPEIRTGEL